MKRREATQQQLQHKRRNSNNNWHFVNKITTAVLEFASWVLFLENEGMQSLRRRLESREREREKFFPQETTKSFQFKTNFKEWTQLKELNKESIEETSSYTRIETRCCRTTTTTTREERNWILASSKRRRDAKRFLVTSSSSSLDCHWRMRLVSKKLQRKRVMLKPVREQFSVFISFRLLLCDTVILCDTRRRMRSRTRQSDQEGERERERERESECQGGNEMRESDKRDCYVKIFEK
jgi:hypothetical protein